MDWLQPLKCTDNPKRPWFIIIPLSGKTFDGQYKPI